MVSKRLSERPRRRTSGFVWTKVAGASLVAAIGAASPCLGQTNERIFETADFRFVTPGARTVGMGHTFIGLADDATAAESNPAGLSNLGEQEFSVEFIVTNWRNRRFVPSAAGTFQETRETVLTPSFFSYVIPAGRLTLGLFRSSIQDYRDQFEFEGRFVPDLGENEDGAFGTIAVTAENYGLAASYVLSSFAAVGGGLTLTSLDLASEARSGTPLSPRNGTNTIDDGVGLGGTVGLLLKPGRGVSIGAVYTHRQAFELTTTLFGSFLFTVPTTPPARVDFVRSGEKRTIDYVIPGRFGAGIAVRPTDRFTLLADVRRVLYSQQITKNFLIADFQDPDAALSSSNFFTNDVTEFHAGAEYRFYGQRRTTALRAGVFTDPDHLLRFRRGGNNPLHPADRFLDFRFNTVPSETHLGWSAGVGVAFANRFQIDGAVSVGPRKREVAVSTVVRLGRWNQ